MLPEIAPDIAIVGGGPTAVYTVRALIDAGFRGRVTVFESGPRVGTGMPYDPRHTHPALLANIASVEIPPIAGATLADWANALAPDQAAAMGVTRPMSDRDFPPRVLLGAYFADGMDALVTRGAERGVRIDLCPDRPVVDIAQEPGGVRVVFGGAAPGARVFGHAVLATGHVWPRSDAADRGRFASPWPTVQLSVPDRARVAVLGSSLSAIDAAVTLALDAGRFVPVAGGVRYDLRPGRALHVTFFSRGGLLPEADFFHIHPYLPLAICTRDAVQAEIDAGADGLLDRAFALMARELAAADPFYATLIDLPALTADSFVDAYFASRTATDPFRHARENLGESRENAQRRRTVAWRYAVLRMHESVAGIVAHLTPDDRARFDAGLKRLFMDNYAAVPLASVERLIALHEAGCLSVERIGTDDAFRPADRGVTLTDRAGTRAFDALIDARGQRALGGADLPFPTLRAQVAGQCDGDGFLVTGDDLRLAAPPGCGGTVQCAAIAFLLRRHPFVQGIVEAARLGDTVARGIMAARGAAPMRRAG